LAGRWTGSASFQYSQMTGIEMFGFQARHSDELNFLPSFVGHC